MRLKTTLSIAPKVFVRVQYLDACHSRVAPKRLHFSNSMSQGPVCRNPACKAVAVPFALLNCDNTCTALEFPFLCSTSQVRRHFCTVQASTARISSISCSLSFLNTPVTVTALFNFKARFLVDLRFLCDRTAHV